MAKEKKQPNYNGKSEKRMKNNFFTQNAQKDSNFLENPRFSIRDNDCIRILRELIQGHININDCIGYLSHPKVINTILTVSYNRYIETKIISESINYFIMSNNYSGNTVDVMYVETQKKYADMCTVYSMINLAFNQFCQYPDPGIILSLVSNLNKYVSVSYNLY